MASDARKHQKQAEKRNKRAKEKQLELVKSRSTTPLTMLRRAGSSTFLPCTINDNVIEKGIGNLVVARLMPNGMVLAVLYLIDLYCLGVKNIMVKCCGMQEYQSSIVRHLERKDKQKIIAKEEAKKLVEGAVAYARQFGIAPHEDHERTKVIFEGVDSSACETEFVYGKDGMPFYIAGPHDGAAFQKRIVALLDRHAGTGNYHYVCMLDGSSFDSGGEWDDAEYDEVE